MMYKQFMSDINKALKPYIEPMHFKHEGQWYVRIVNDQILQAFNFQGTSGTEFYVNIEIIPLCIEKLPSYRHYYSFRMESFVGGFPTYWSCEHGKEEVVQILREKVLPVFEELTTYEAVCNTIRPYILERPDRKLGVSNGETYDELLFYALNFKAYYCMCVRLNLFDEALMCCEQDLKDAYIEEQYFISKYEQNTNEDWYDKTISIYNKVKIDRITRINEQKRKITTERDAVFSEIKACELENLQRFAKYRI